jgi:hypothetical protein
MMKTEMQMMKRGGFVPCPLLYTIIFDVCRYFYLMLSNTRGLLEYLQPLFLRAFPIAPDVAGLNNGGGAGK